MTARNKLYLAALIPLIAAGLLLVRVAQQIKTGVFTAWDTFYVPDAVAGYVPTDTDYLSVGWTIFGDPNGLNIFLFPLGVLGVAGIALGILVAAWVVLRLEAKSGRPSKLRPIVWLVALSSLFFPVYALLADAHPQNATATLPQLNVATGKTGALPALGQGTFSVIAMPSMDVAASIQAGGDTFKASFGEVSGTLTANFADLASAAQAQFTLVSGSVVTGNKLRDQHAAEHLKSEAHPNITLQIVDGIKASQISADEIGIKAQGKVMLAGVTQQVPVEATVKVLSADDKSHLKITKQGTVVLVKANFTLSIANTPVDDGETFDKKEIPISVLLAMAKQANAV